MSIVNRMLQDIDRRSKETANGIAGVLSDTRSVEAAGHAKPGAMGVWSLALFTGVALVAMFVWLAQPGRQDELPPPAQTPVLAKPESKPVPTPVTAAPASPPETAVIAEAAASAAAAKPPTDTLRLSLKLSAPASDAPVTRVSPPAAKASATSIAPGTTTISNIPVRQIAAEETILAARGLWDSGSRDGAIATLAEALSTAEAARNRRTTAMLAQELARFQVSDNRKEEALALLKRLENVLTEDPEAWALRGNVEQRLAMHSEAAQSYLTALQMRPAEGRWMVGAAISLAATGKMDEARLWADRARERSAITPAISIYLQQLGITVRQ